MSGVAGFQRAGDRQFALHEILIQRGSNERRQRHLASLPPFLRTCSQ